jgi:hypothetical protein
MSWPASACLPAPCAQEEGLKRFCEFIQLVVGAQVRGM